ncbi:MAG: hypothetical protein LBV56_06515 [Delftia acidovorans]|jgi:hypothetical protein|nr:hypothetical protein [Delftia acidovorans]
MMSHGDSGFYDWPGLSIRCNIGRICRNGLETGISRPGAAGIVYKLAGGVCCKMHPAPEDCVQYLKPLRNSLRNSSDQTDFIFRKINYINNLHEIHLHLAVQRKYILVSMTGPGICIHGMHG